MTMNEYEEEIDVFKVLSHPLRRKIIKFIAEKGAVSYSDLIKIVPKPGALYHHLRLLGDLVYQDESRMYRLSEKGQRIYDILISDFFVPEDKFIHKILTPRMLFEKIEGWVAITLVVIYLASNLVWICSSELLPIFILIGPVRHNWYAGIVFSIFNWIISCIMLKFIIKCLYKRRVHLLDLLTRTTIPLLLVNIYPIAIAGRDFIVVGISYVLIQFFGLLFMISAVSVVARLPLRSSLAVVIILHYASLIATTTLIFFGSVGLF